MAASEMPERYNVSTILDANLEAGRGAKAAIVGEYGEVSYERLLAMACAAGRGLRALGVQREQRVLMVMDDTPAFPAVFCGAIRAGMVPVPLNPLFKADDYRYLLADSEARAVVADLDLLPKVREALAGHGEPVPVVVAGGEAAGRPHPGRPAGRARRRAGPGPDPPRRRRLLAVQLRLHRPAQGGRPPPARPALHLPDLRRPGAWHRRGRPVPVDHQAVPRLRPRQQPVVPVLGGGDLGPAPRPPRPRPGPGRRRAPPAEPAVLGPHPLQRHAGHPRGQAAGPVVGAAVRLGRRVAAGRDLAALARHLRPGHPRRHRLHRDAAHLLLQHHRPAAARVQRHGRARLRPQAARRHRRAGPQGGDRHPVRPRRQRPGRLLAPARQDQADGAGGLGLDGRPLPPGRRRVLVAPGPGRRHAQGRRPVGVAGGDGAGPGRAPGRLRVRRRPGPGRTG